MDFSMQFLMSLRSSRQMLAILAVTVVITFEGKRNFRLDRSHGQRTCLSISLSIFSNNASECSWAKVLMRRKLRFPLY